MKWRFRSVRKKYVVWFGKSPVRSTTTPHDLPTEEKSKDIPGLVGWQESDIPASLILNVCAYVLQDLKVNSRNIICPNTEKTNQTANILPFFVLAIP
jgi:hypothetical protein